MQHWFPKNSLPYFQIYQITENIRIPFPIFPNISENRINQNFVYWPPGMWYTSPGKDNEHLHFATWLGQLPPAGKGCGREIERSAEGKGRGGTQISLKENSHTTNNWLLTGSWLTLFKPEEGGTHCAPPVTYLRINYNCANTRTSALKNLTFPIEFGKGHYAFYHMKLYRFAEKKYS